MDWVKFVCEECCPKEMDPPPLAYLEGKVYKAEKRCRIVFCLKTWEKKNPGIWDFMRVAVHELTHCELRHKEKQYKKGECSRCICNEIQANVRDTPGIDIAGLKERAKGSCLKRACDRIPMIGGEQTGSGANIPKPVKGE